MKSEQWLHAHYEVSFEELCELSGLSQAELRELVASGVLVPTDPAAQEWSFSADRLTMARSARRLRRDFELDSDAVALVTVLLERIRDLEAEIRDLRARLPGAMR
ncbi:MAG TPA: chaperone modulator CbpM [Burkholderiales bacterium]|nr:chaperone modulator CbpM [Burkholderiales bacterium]